VRELMPSFVEIMRSGNGLDRCLDESEAHPYGSARLRAAPHLRGGFRHSMWEFHPRIY
jgi:hypothetical protein